MRLMTKTMTYEQYLEQYDTMTYRNVGVSMLPMLRQGRDTFTVTKKTNQRCKQFDVILYRRPPSSYVLHRIIEVRSHDYVVLGDNCINKEYVKENDIIGVLSSFTHKGKSYPVSDKRYRLYVHIWCKTAFVRIVCKKIRIRLQRKLHAA